MILKTRYSVRGMRIWSIALKVTLTWCIYVVAPCREPGFHRWGARPLFSEWRGGLMAGYGSSMGAIPRR